MALKGDHHIIEDDISLTGETATERGVILMYQTAGSGIALGDSRGQAYLAADPSGLKVAGLLFDDVVDVDLTIYQMNWHKDEVKKGNPVCLVRKGRVTTNKILAGQTPTAGSVAYVTTSGQLTPTVSATGGVTATPPVGKFHSSKDADGYATVDINIPIV